MLEVAPEKLFLYRAARYNLNDEQRMKLKRLLAEITGKRVTGEVVLNCTQGSPASLETREEIE